MGLTEFLTTCYVGTPALFPAAHHSLTVEVSLRTSGLLLLALQAPEAEAPVRGSLSILQLVMDASPVSKAALIVLLQALVIGLTEAGVPAGWSALIVGVVVAVIAYILIRKGTNDLKGSNLAPSRTVDSLRRDAQVVKEQAR